ncbi:unnamed protein product [Phytophthora fragariaefolia]|uniref:Unnamed protein product n=1 Tax=Phytophthora fragariaefolia TaxID=1490495 RepID=A0A9W6Y0K5_9STRA|nr:unnamed protein product [Phytophthora fragariaefolia]
MARTKNKRTREEIEQAMRDNERLNGTLAAPEEPAAKKRRQARRRSKRYNLNKEFQALAVDATEGTTAAASRPPVTTAVQEPAPGTGVPLALVHTPILAPTVNDADRLRHEQRRAQETPDERSARLARERAHQEERRVNLSQQQEEAEQAYRREYQAMQRDGRDDEENEEARQNERTRRGSLRRGHALANHEDFRVSMLSGPNIVDGRHKLPPTTVCPHCNAWKWPAESKKPAA